MTDIIIILLSSMLPIMVAGIVWLVVRLYTQDKRLRSIAEKLEMHPDSSLQQQYIQEHTQQLSMMISMLNKVLWSLRFDEDKYAAECTSAIENNVAEPGNDRIKSINMASEAFSEMISAKS